MGRRRGLVEDILELGLRLSWQACLIAALVTAVVFQGLAALLITHAAPAAHTSLGGYALRNFAGTLLRLLGIVVPLALAFAALISALRRSQAISLHEEVHTGGIDIVRRMSWSQFERLIGEAFRRKGFDVRENGGGGDGGVDLRLTKDGCEYLVQCKHWRAQSVGVTVIRELNGVVAARGAAGGFVVTSGSFTPEARAFAKACSIELIDGKQLEEMIRQTEADSSGAPSATSVNAAKSCPRCGSAMVRRVAKKGSYAGSEFWGCSRYPDCRGLSPI